MMKRAQIQLDEEVYELLRSRAFQEKRSISGVIREIIRKEVTPSGHSRSSTVKDFGFVASGQSKQDSRKIVSKGHDEALMEVFQE